MYGICVIEQHFVIEICSIHFFRRLNITLDYIKMPCDEQISKLVYKRLRGTSDVDSNRPFYTEPFKSYPIIEPNNSIWAQASSIPATAPALSSGQTSGVVQYWQNLTLTSVSGAPNAFYDPLLVDSIPFNKDSIGWSYRPVLRDFSGTTTYKFTESDWFIDNSAGTLVFYKNMPSGISSISPPKITFYRYVGMKGIVAPAQPLGDPTSGGFSYTLRLENNLTLADAIQYLDVVLSEFSGAPGDASDTTLTLVDPTYTARLADGSVGTLVTAVQVAGNKPQTNVTAPLQYAGTGTIAAFINGVSAGSITMTAGDDSGTNGALVIDSDYDLFANTNAPGLYKACTLHIAPTVALNSIGPTPVTYQIRQTGLLRNGNPIPDIVSNVLSFYLNEASVPIVIGQAITAVGGATTNVSGVPRLNAGQTLTVTFTLAFAVVRVFHQTRVAEVTLGTSTVNVQPVSATENQTLAGLTGAVVLDPNVYHSNVQISITGYTANNTAGATVQATATAGLEIDTNTQSLNESAIRVQSGLGQFGTGGALGTAFNSATSLATNEELQMINGKFQFPSAIDYSATLTGGPDYSSLPAPTFNNMRWVTFDLGALSSTTTSTISLNITGTDGWPTTTLWPTTGGNADSVDIYIRDGSGVWIAGNKAFDPYETYANGVGGLVISESSPTTRVITRGTTSFTGNLLIRVGIKSGSSAKFASCIC